MTSNRRNPNDCLNEARTVVGAVCLLASLVVALCPAKALSPQAGWSAQDVFLDRCAVCHARDGSGKTVKGRKDKIKDIRKTIDKMPEAQIAEVVEKGKGAYMDSFSKQYSPQQI
ncbi:MAG: c-type cytochrome [Terriglobia bacterium]